MGGFDFPVISRQHRVMLENGKMYEFSLVGRIAGNFLMLGVNQRKDLDRSFANILLSQRVQVDMLFCQNVVPSVPDKYFFTAKLSDEQYINPDVLREALSRIALRKTDVSEKIFLFNQSEIDEIIGQYQLFFQGMPHADARSPIQRIGHFAGEAGGRPPFSPSASSPTKRS